jgi:uncharacterized membrane protein
MEYSQQSTPPTIPLIRPLQPIADRLTGPDALRGLVILLMALDHVRYFWFKPGFSPTDLEHTWPALFFTRWITHLCAPTFIFLAGMGAALYQQRRAVSRPGLAGYLLSRGLWLILLEMTWNSYFWTLQWQTLELQVLWALGGSMIILSGLIFLPRGWIAVLALVGIAGHDLLNGIEPARFGQLAWLWQILHVEGLIDSPLPGLLPRWFVIYPLLPWFNVMALGYAVAPWLQRPAAQTNHTLVLTGGLLLLAFTGLRFFNQYGEATAWHVQPRGELFTWMSFLNLSKYPPSLLYLLATLGLMCWLLAALGQGRSLVHRTLLLFGRVPLFFYLLHIPLIHGLASVWKTFAGPAITLPGCYLIGLLVVVLLYFPCLWFARVKMRAKGGWTGYF